MTLGGLLTEILHFVIGDATATPATTGILGDDFALFIAVGVVLSLAATQLPRLAKRLR